MPPQPTRPQRQTSRRTKGLVARLIVSLLAFNLALFGYLHRHHEITKLRYELPRLEDEVAQIDEAIATLRYKVATAESPARCQALVTQGDYSHLKPPTRAQVEWIAVP